MLSLGCVGFGVDRQPLYVRAWRWWIGAQLYAVASRSAEKAYAFQAKYHAEKALSSYEALVADPQVDIVYVATPHPMHLRHAQMALKAGQACAD